MKLLRKIFGQVLCLGVYFKLTVCIENMKKKNLNWANLTLCDYVVYLRFNLVKFIQLSKIQFVVNPRVLL